MPPVHHSGTATRQPGTAIAVTVQYAPAVPRRLVWPSIIVGAVLLIVGVGTVSYLRRIGPQYPAVEGSPFTIELLPSGCPKISAGLFADTPGQFVPPNPTEVVLCATPTPEFATQPTGSGPPEQRVLQSDAAGFAALLNQLPDRNTWFRNWQRRHSGFWPDAAPVFACTMMAVPYDFSFVLRYADRPPVPLVTNCTGWTDGVRTRIDPGIRAGEHIVDEFIRRFTAQA